MKTLKHYSLSIILILSFASLIACGSKQSEGDKISGCLSDPQCAMTVQAYQSAANAPVVAPLLGGTQLASNSVPGSGTAATVIGGQPLTIASLKQSLSNAQNASDPAIRAQAAKIAAAIKADDNNPDSPHYNPASAELADAAVREPASVPAVQAAQPATAAQDSSSYSSSDGVASR